MFSRLAFLLALLPLALAALGDDGDLDREQDRLFLREAQDHCRADGGLVSCAKYRTALAVHRLAGSRRALRVGPLRLVSVNGTELDGDDPFPSGRSAPGETGMVRLFKFGLRQLRSFVASHGISVPVGEGAQLVTDDGADATADAGDGRGIHTKKKLALLFPLLVILKFGIIKAILVPILLSLLFIKKILVLGVMALPSILSMIKACKITTPFHQPYHGVEDYSYSPEVTSYGGYGAYGGYEPYGNGNKDWAAAQRKNRWGKADQAD